MNIVRNESDWYVRESGNVSVPLERASELASFVKSRLGYQRKIKLLTEGFNFSFRWRNRKVYDYRVLYARHFDYLSSFL